MMNDRKMSRRTALTLTAAAATGAAILADAKPALATWPTITSPDGPNGLVGTSRTKQPGGDVTGALTAASKAISEMLAGVNTVAVRYQGTELTNWKLIEDVLVAAAAAVEQYQESPDLDKKNWHWKHPKKPHNPAKH
ncbi:MAG: hypothetical protein M3Z07_01775 [Candidatus Eremiobacteraeota bacterium]|nr:hypothetical protein [Candidatus Eremiobacteraeota bacterium]